MKLASQKMNVDRGNLSSLNLLFWSCFIFWAILPSTKTPWFEINSVPINSKDLSLIVLSSLYLLLPMPKISNFSTTSNSQPWHYQLPTLTIGLLLYATISTGWSGMNSDDMTAMLYTLALTGSGLLCGYLLIAKRDIESVRSFLWLVTVALAAVSMLYFAESFFSLGLGTVSDYESETFGIQRVKGPLFVSTTGIFILLPALAFAIQELIRDSSWRLLKLVVIASLTLTIIGLGSRSGLLLLGLFFFLMLLFVKNKRQARIAMVTILIITIASTSLIFSKAKTERLQSLEDSSRSDTYLTSFQIIENRDYNLSFLGSGYGSYWPWYITEVNDPRDSDRYYNLTPYGALLYHPHSTFLLCIVELGVLGLIYFIFLWSVLLRLLFRNFRNAEFPIFSCGVFVSGLSMFFDFFLFRAAQVNALWWLFLFGALTLNSNLTLSKKTFN